MATMTISLTEPLKEWVEAQARSGRYADASDYVQDLIARDLNRRHEDVEWLFSELGPALRADEREFVEVSAETVIRRNMMR